MDKIDPNEQRTKRTMNKNTDATDEKKKMQHLITSRKLCNAM